MNAVCPRNSAHQRFATTAHVMELWEVRPDGSWVETIAQLETSFKPDPGNIWNCLDCDDEGVECEALVT